MLLAYIDETGEPGAYISSEHPKYRTSPAFGYAGFVIPEEAAWDFGARFQREKRVLFATEIAEAEHPGRWERKGASIFRPRVPENFPQQIRVFNALVRRLRDRHGYLFYYADEKPIGTPKQTRLNPVERESQAMAETLNRLARHADRRNSNILVMIDQINEKTRADRLPRMYESDLRRAFTHESKLHFNERSIEDINHFCIFSKSRPLYPVPGGPADRRECRPGYGSQDARHSGGGTATAMIVSFFYRVFRDRCCGSTTDGEMHRVA